MRDRRESNPELGGCGEQHPRVPRITIPHYPQNCAACNAQLTSRSDHKPYMRYKEELLHLISSAFIGWLVTDGYGAYSSYEKRQHCLAHLIRKAIALTEVVDLEAADLGQ